MSWLTLGEMELANSFKQDLNSIDEIPTYASKNQNPDWKHFGE
jgi:uncharacterized protein (DUF779 family)